MCTVPEHQGFPEANAAGLGWTLQAREGSEAPWHGAPVARSTCGTGSNGVLACRAAQIGILKYIQHLVWLLGSQRQSWVAFCMALDIILNRLRSYIGPRPGRLQQARLYWVSFMSPAGATPISHGHTILISACPYQDKEVALRLCFFSTGGGSRRDPVTSNRVGYADHKEYQGSKIRSPLELNLRILQMPQFLGECTGVRPTTCVPAWSG